MSELNVSAEGVSSSDAEDVVQPNVEQSYSASDQVNVAFFRNATPILMGIDVTNNLESDLSDVTAAFSSEPPFITPGSVTISRIKAGSRRHLPAPDHGTWWRPRR
jgi:hypothetical protein